MAENSLKNALIEDFNAKTYVRFMGDDRVKFGIVRDLVSRDRLPKRICDLGCGDGKLGSMLIAAGHDVSGADISEAALESARQKGLRIFKVNLEDYRLPFRDGEFDAVTACEIIEHIYDTDRFLQEIRRILKPRGILVITTPNTVSLGRRICYLLGRGDFFEPSLSGESAGHIRYFVKGTLADLLKSNGFKPEAFYSDLVNFTPSGSIRSRWLARMFPALGGSLIMLAQKL